MGVGSPPETRRFIPFSPLRPFSNLEDLLYSDFDEYKGHVSLILVSDIIGID